MEHLPKGARSMGLGNAHVTLVDSWAVFNNIGSLGLFEGGSQAFVGYDHRLGLNELTTLAAGFIAPAGKLGMMGIGISSYGGELFNQQQIGIGISNQLGLASLGLKVSYFQTNIEGFGRKASPILEIGGTAELLPQLFFGAHIYNITRSSLSRITNEYLPTVVKAGISYRPSEALMLNVETEKEIRLPTQFKAGIEYNIQDKLWARTGINTQPNHLFFGIGFKPKRFHLDYAMSRNFLLGFTHHFALNYQFNEN
ncbi:MAG: hypothetical protein WD398_10680 [Cyclobacteriaceae bacterium]